MLVIEQLVLWWLHDRKGIWSVKKTKNTKYHTTSYIYVHSKADVSWLNLTHETKLKTEKEQGRVT